MASYSGPRAAKAATFWSTTEDTAAARAGDGAADGRVCTDGGTGVGTLRVIGTEVGVAALAGGDEKRGTTGRAPVGAGNGTADAEAVGTRLATDAVGTDGVGIIGARTGAATDTGAGAGAAGAEVIGRGGSGTGAPPGICGLDAATGGLTDGKPIMVRAIAGRAAAGAAVTGAAAGSAGCGVREAGIDPDGRAPGISDGRGEACDGGGVGETAGLGPDGRVGGLTPQVDAAGADAGPRSMVISP